MKKWRGIMQCVALVLVLSVITGQILHVAAVESSTVDEYVDTGKTVQSTNTGVTEYEDSQIITYVNPMYSDVVDVNQLAEVWQEMPNIERYSTTEAVELDEAAEILREKLAAREIFVEINVKMAEFRRTEAPLLVYRAAVEHTGIPNEGDYIVYNGCAWSASVDYENTGDGYIFTIRYNLQYFTDAQQELQVDEMVNSVLQELNLWDATDYEKVLGIYQYICDNVAYDYANVDNEKYTQQYTAYAALIDKTAVCQGYALLFYRLTLELGVDTRLITGIGAGGAHAWNIVQLGGQYYNLDATWDAGLSAYSYFLCGEETFTDHLRDEQFSTVQFKAEYPASTHDYTSEGDPADGLLEAGECGVDCTWTFTTDNVLRIIGSGEMTDYTAQTTPWSQYAYRIQEIEISDEITQIGNYAFSDCTALGDVIIPDTVQSVGEYAFSGCDYLQSVDLPSELTTLENGVFSRCGLLDQINLPVTVTEIGDNAFAKCIQLKEIAMSEGLTAIGNAAFQGCSNLVRIELPEALMSVGNNAFADCSSLVYAYFQGDVPSYGTGIFSGTPGYFCVYYNDGKTGWSVPTWNEYDSAVWTDEVLENFGKCGLDAYWIFTEDNTLVIWGKGEINFELEYDPGQTPWDHVQYEINAIVIKEGISAIGNSVFGQAQNVQNVSLPEGLERIGWGAFYYCESIKEIELPESLSIIDTCAFDYCSSLQQVYIPANTTQINAHSFTNCTSLQTIEVDSKNSRYYSVDGVLFDVATDTLMVYPAGKTEESYQVPDGISQILDSAFASSKLYTVDIPDSVSEIRNGAFGRCINLEEITIPGNVSKINGATFSGCTNLKEITIPEGVYIIEVGAFASCNNLKTINLPTTLTEIEMHAFSGCTSLESISIPEGQTRIYSHTFANCWNLTDITIPNSVEEIEQFAFNSCTSLTSITIPEGVTTIQNGVFMDCTSLADISIPESLIFVGADAFANTPWLETAAGEDGFVIINNSLYKYMGDDSAPIIPKGVTAISASAFSYNNDIVCIIIPDTVLTIENYTFYCCQAMKRVYLPSTITNIGLGAFGACSALCEIYYAGTQEQWESIPIGADNYHLFQTNIRSNFEQYEFMDGEDETVNISGGEVFSIRIDADCSDFNEVYINGQLVDPQYYTVTEGSTIITICADYLQTLGEGNHTVEIVFTEGAAVTKMTLAYLYTAGDINGDGKVNNRDAARLMQYLAGWDVDYVEAALDVNGDGKVNNRDAARLLQYLAGWDVVIQ